MPLLGQSFINFGTQQTAAAAIMLQKYGLRILGAKNSFQFFFFLRSNSGTKQNDANGLLVEHFHSFFIGSGTNAIPFFVGIDQPQNGSQNERITVDREDI